jgi:UDP-N-acetylglucosamine:LPS N-acetylglucosamine transferase
LIFASVATHGHTYPLIPLALAAREAGHDVVFATGEQFLPALRQAGLGAVAAGIGVREAFSRLQVGAERPSPAEMGALVGKVFGDIVPRQVVADLGPILDANRPDLVIYEGGNVGAGLAARLAGIPVVGHGFGRESKGALSELFDSPLRAYAGELGVDLPDEYPHVLGRPYLDIYPPSLGEPEFDAAIERIELRPVAWTEPGDLPDGVRDRDRDRPLVYLTLGTAFGNVDVLRQAIEGLSRLPVDVLVAAGPTVGVADLGEVRENVRLAAWVPQAELLPYVDLVAHHGGSGTTLGALAAGLPQLFLPQGADQFINAEAVLAAGAGGRILPDEFSADVVTEHARRLLADESVLAAARRLAEEIAAMPSPGEVARRLPELA